MRFLEKEVSDLENIVGWNRGPYAYPPRSMETALGHYGTTRENPVCFMFFEIN